MKKFETAVFQEIVECTFWDDLKETSVKERIEWFYLPDEVLEKFKEKEIIKDDEYVLTYFPYELLGELGFEFKNSYTVTINNIDSDPVKNKIVTTIITQREI